jgi:hypothetical protein
LKKGWKTISVHLTTMKKKEGFFAFSAHHDAMKAKKSKKT